MLEAAVAAGVAAAGGEALLGGVLPTPGAPLLIGRYGLDLGVVISASHNPYRDNGIKFFAGDGFKLDDDTEIEIETALDEPPPRTTDIGAVRRLHGALEDYLRGLHQRFADLDLSGRRVLLDCANGATHRAAPEIFRRLGAEVDLLAADPDGRNINDGCGSTHVESLADTMREGNARRRLRLRRRRRPRARGRPQRRRRRRRRADRARRAAPARQRPPPRQRRRRDRDDQLRLPHGDARRRHRRRDDAGRRPLRARGAARARLGARRRAVGPHHRHGLRALGRRHRRRAAHARGAGRRRPLRAPRDGEAAAAARQRADGRPRRARRRHERRPAGRSSAR